MSTKKEREYEEKVLQWRARKYDELVRENGWLALAGLFWLKEGRNLIGSNPMCEVVLPEHAPTFVGVVELKGGTAHFMAAEGVRVKVNGRLVEKAVLRSSREAKPSFITWDESLRMVVHEHAGRYAIRIWDNTRKERFAFPPLKWFPIERQFRIAARYTRYKQPPTLEHSDTFGDTVEERIDGYVTFRFGGLTCKLDAIEKEDGALFIRFRDGTSGVETYPPGRYCYTEVVKNGRVTLDFNFAYNPPCAYTPYATCVFAPPQNSLPFRVEAGEMYQKDSG
jgi:uncharacterized protein (DUF1684 family)